MYDSAISIKEINQEEATDILKKLKPGAHFFIICEPTKYHRIACYTEDAGFEIRDQMIWLHDGGHKSIVMARKPLSENTVAANVLKYGVGALNIDACRIEAAPGDEPMKWETPRGGIWATDSEAEGALVVNSKGRYPANVMHDGSESILSEFEKYGDKGAGGKASGVSLKNQSTSNSLAKGMTGVDDDYEAPFYADKGSASRFFKTIKDEETIVKYLQDMVTPPSGECLVLK